MMILSSSLKPHIVAVTVADTVTAGTDKNEEQNDTAEFVAANALMMGLTPPQALVEAAWAEEREWTENDDGDVILVADDERDVGTTALLNFVEEDLDSEVVEVVFFIGEDVFVETVFFAVVVDFFVVVDFSVVVDVLEEDLNTLTSSTQSHAVVRDDADSAVMGDVVLDLSRCQKFLPKLRTVLHTVRCRNCRTRWDI